MMVWGLKPQLQNICKNIIFVKCINTRICVVLFILDLRIIMIISYLVCKHSKGAILSQYFFKYKMIVY